MALEKGDFIRINYTGRIKETGEVFDTTYEEVAREAGIYRENMVFKPQPIVLGAGHIIKGLEEVLIGGEVGEKKEVEIPPEKAFGERDPKLVKTFRLRDFRKHGLKPYPGMIVEIEGKAGRVQRVNAGRVVVDFNSELAGKTVVYEVIVEEKVNKLEEKIRLLIERYFQKANPHDFKIECSDGKAVIEIPANVAVLQSSVLGKLAVANDILKYLDIKEVEFREIFRKKEEATSASEEQKSD